MSESQNFEQVIIQITQEGLKAIQEADNHRKILTGIIIEDIADDQKLLKLRNAILKYNASRGLISNHKIDLEGMCNDAFKANLLIQSLQVNNDNMNVCTKLFSAIANIIKHEEMTVESKVDQIAVLLM